MRYDDISENLKDTSFDFFYWYSRFEFVLKEHGFLKFEEAGARAEPSWEKFREKFKNQYVVTQAGSKLLELHPKRQIVGTGRRLDWKPTGIDHCNTDLCRVIAMLSTIRNNLFHGGKSGDIEVDDIKRNVLLLTNGKVVLDELAKQFGYEDDYLRCY